MGCQCQTCLVSDHIEVLAPSSNRLSRLNPSVIANKEDKPEKADFDNCIFVSTKAFEQEDREVNYNIDVLNQEPEKPGLEEKDGCQNRVFRSGSMNISTKSKSIYEKYLEYEPADNKSTISKRRSLYRKLMQQKENNGSIEISDLVNPSSGAGKATLHTNVISSLTISS